MMLQEVDEYDIFLSGCEFTTYADVAELADAPDLGSGASANSAISAKHEYTHIEIII